ncbi:S49 family peptidase, partial [Candidatus Dependentiae bacterium]|nr:S49 family peptidase [Candidatus Dependentiae bacterium]
DRARADLQKRVDQSYDLFVQTVARNRKLDPQVIYDTQAGIYRGEEAVNIGLADKVLTYDGVIAEITKKISKPKTTAKGVFNMEGFDIKGFCDKLKELVTAKNTDVLAQLKDLGMGTESLTPQAEVDRIKAEARTEADKMAAERVKGIFNLCTLAGASAMARGLIEEGLTVEQSQEKILKAKADQSQGQAVYSTVGATTTGESNPLLENAKQRAGIK